MAPINLSRHYHAVLVHSADVPRSVEVAAHTYSYLLSRVRFEGWRAIITKLPDFRDLFVPDEEG